MRARALLAACTLACAWALPAPAQEEKVSRLGEYRGYAPVLHPQAVRTSIYHRLRDGTRIAMDIHRPADADGRPVDTPYPVLWQHALVRRNPADQGDSVIPRMPQLTRYGYVVVVAERRGGGASFGARRGYNDRTEARDAYEITEWLARQPWSTGKVGVYGCSNTGDAAMHAATTSPPSLKAVFAGCFSWSKYDGFRRGGIPAQWGFGPEQPLEDQLRNAFPVDGDDDRTLLRQAVEQHRDNTPLAALWRSMPFRDSWSDIVASRFWLEGSVATHRDGLERGGAAYYIFGGWKDDFRREGLVAWATLRRKPARIVIGPWTHCRNPGFDLLADAHRFFDRWLKGVDNGIDREAPVHLYTSEDAPARAWRSHADWPAPGTTLQRLALSATAADAEDQLLDGSPRQTTLSLKVGNPTPCVEAASQTQPCSQAANALRYTGPALAADTAYTGHALAQLWIASPQPDQDVFVYLEDLAPDGSATIVTEGRLRASHRATHRAPYDVLGLPWPRSLEEDHQPLVPGQPVLLRLDLLPMSHLFKAGHRLRVVLAGNDPRQRPPPPTGHTLQVISTAGQPSYLELPTVPGRP